MAEPQDRRQGSEEDPETASDSRRPKDESTRELELGSGTFVEPVPPAASKGSSEASTTKGYSSVASYRRVKLLGEGGLGQVWLARDMHIDREVAIKELHPRGLADAKTRARFLREARIGARLQHPNIAPFYHIGVDASEKPFIVMQCIGGVTLEERVLELRTPDLNWTNRRSELHQFVTMLLQVCEGVAYAHSRDILHRDLKPSNVMAGEFGKVFILDWGLGKQMDWKGDAELSGIDVVSDVARELSEGTPESVVTQDGTLMGTLAYMSPEQAAGLEIGTSSDVFGLGGILHFILTGKPPHERGFESTEAMVRRIQTKPPQNARLINSSCPRRLAAIAAKATALNTCDRYGSAQELADDLRRWLAGDSVSALPDGIVTKAIGWAAKHPIPAMSLLSLVAAVGVVIFAQWEYARLHHRVATEQTTARLRGKLHEAASQTNADLEVVGQMLEYLRELWSRTIVKEGRPQILDLPLPAQLFLRDTLVPLADENAIYVDVAYFDPHDRMRAQVARDEAISPFVIARQNESLPSYVIPLLQRAKKESNRVRFGDVQIEPGKGRLLVPVAGAVVVDGIDCGALAIHVDLVNRVISALVASARSEPTFLCLFDNRGQPLFEVDERNEVTIAAGGAFAERFPELADLGSTALASMPSIYMPERRLVAAATTLELGNGQSDCSLIAVMGISEDTILAEGISIRQALGRPLLLGTTIAAVAILAFSVFLARHRSRT